MSSVEPNPSDQQVTIHFSLDDTRDVGLDIYDVRGRRIRMLIDGICEPGQHSVIWDGKDETGSPVGAGIYFCRLTAGERQAMQKIVRFR